MTGLVLSIVILVVVLVALAIAVTMRQRRRRLQEKFGPEYERSVATSGDRKEAERGLRDQAARRDELDIRPLGDEARARYADEWAQVQARFVDEPGQAVDEADTLVARVMRERGYPVDDFQSRVDMAAVDHPDVVSHYRAAHQIHEANAEGAADTEQLRSALVHYRELFTVLLAETQTEKDEAAR
jgi:hypothetical protein